MLRFNRNTFLKFLVIFITITSAKSSRSQLDTILSKQDSVLWKLDDLKRQLDDLKLHNCEQKSSESEIISKTVSSTVFAAAAAASNCETKYVCHSEGVHPFEFASVVKDKKLICNFGHWVVIMQRFDGSVDFHTKNWEAYKNGFGQLDRNKEFFMGLESLHDLMTFKENQRWELRIDLEDFDGIHLVAFYDNFKIDNEDNAFKLRSLGSYSGDAGDSFSYHVGQKFTTLDRDNDAKVIGSCGEEFNSAGWFKSCMEANLMGRYLRGENNKFKEGMYWETFRGPEYSLKKVKMSIRERC